MANAIINRGLIAETGVIPAGFNFLQDSYSFTPMDTKKAITEGYDGSEVQVMRVTGLLQKGDTANANNRIYSTRDVLRPAVDAIQEDVKNRAVIGEFDHPCDAKIHLEKASHLISNLWVEGKNVYGTAEVLYNLPLGAALRGLFEHKVRVGISSRGVGDMEVVESGGRELYTVLPGYAFVTWDVVAEPSVNGAILQIQESISGKAKAIKRELLKDKGHFDQSVYSRLLVQEINKFFSL